MNTVINHTLILNVEARKDKIETTWFPQRETAIARQNQCDCGVLYVFLNVERE